MSNWYISLCAFKRATGNNDAFKDPVISRNIEAASRKIEGYTSRFFLPKTQTRTYRWPGRYGAGVILWTDQDLISVTTLQTKAQDSSPTTVSACDFFLEPNNSGPPFNRVEIDLSSGSAFESGDTPQRSVSIAGCWGYTSNTRCGGTVDVCGGINASTTSLTVSDASKVDVGHTIQVDCERLFVANRTFAALGSILLNGALTADMSEVTVTVDASHGILAGEVIRVESERMFVISVSGNDLTVIRAYDGSVLAAHADNTAVHINRTLTVERGANGTTAAAHCDATSICVYEPEFDIQQWALAEALAMYHQEAAGWGRTIGQGEGATEMSGRGLAELRRDLTVQYKRLRAAAI